MKSIKFEVQKISPKRGDLVIFRVPENSTIGQMNSLATLVRTVIPKESGIKCLILKNNIDISVNNEGLVKLLKQLNIENSYG